MAAPPEEVRARNGSEAGDRDKEKSRVPDLARIGTPGTGTSGTGGP